MNDAPKTDPAMPELPEPAGVILVGTQALRAFTASQMEAYARATLAATAPSALEGEREALAELVALKDLKDKIDNAAFLPLNEAVRVPEMREEYERRKPLAWKAARRAIASAPAPEVPTDTNESSDGVHHIGWTTEDWDELCTVEEKLRWAREDPESQQHASKFTEKVYAHC